MAPEDREALVKAMRGARNKGVSIEAGLGLAPGWSAAARRRARDAVVRELLGADGGGRQGARNLFDELRRYQARRYSVDKAAEAPPTGQRGRLFALLETNGGQVLSVDRLR